NGCVAGDVPPLLVRPSGRARAPPRPHGSITQDEGKEPMNIILWIIQIALAFLYIAGGAYKVFKGDTLTHYPPGLSRGGWAALGAIELAGGILLVVRARVTGIPLGTALAAAVLALETLILAALFARRSVKLVAANPLVWAAPMGLLAALVAYGRYTP